MLFNKPAISINFLEIHTCSSVGIYIPWIISDFSKPFKISTCFTVASTLHKLLPFAINLLKIPTCSSVANIYYQLHPVSMNCLKIPLCSSMANIYHKPPAVLLFSFPHGNNHVLADCLNRSTDFNKPLKITFTVLTDNADCRMSSLFRPSYPPPHS